MPGTGSDDCANGQPHDDAPVTVLVVDDQDSFRGAVRELVNATDGFTLVGEAASGEDALRAADELSPSFVIVDKRMAGMDGVQTTRLLTARHPEAMVLLVSVEEPDPQLMRACGAAAFARKWELSRKLLRDVWREHGRRATGPDRGRGT